MLSFHELPPFGKTIVTALFFIAFSLGICLIFAEYAKKYRLPKILLIVANLTSYTAMLLYATSLRSARLQKPVSAIAEAFCEWPVFILIQVLIIIFLYHSFVIIKEISYKKKTLTQSSIKEGIDKLSSGLCYYHDSGRIILMNSKMDSLSHSIFGRDLQNADLFLKNLREGLASPSVAVLSTDSQPTLRLPDGSAWMFTHSRLDNINQLVATDITHLQNIADELENKNEQLKALNLRLKKYGENVDELTREKERLEIKARIHRELGQALLASRRFLLSNNEEDDAPVERWQRIIALLHKEAVTQEDEKPIAMLTRAAKAMGINLEITGKLPLEHNVQLMFVQAAAEALTNAISHAGAKTLYMSFLHDVYDYIAQFTNDGAPPAAKIVEGGGLSSLRQKIEREGGTMIVDSHPEFTLTVILPMKGGDDK
ncbi:MAG: hypothetical protein IKL36_05185 [Clostridia bacterium]|nr:hypothetical protein [Clostridia bacterium]